MWLYHLLCAYTETRTYCNVYERNWKSQILGILISKKVLVYDYIRIRLINNKGMYTQLVSTISIACWQSLMKWLASVRFSCCNRCPFRVMLVSTWRRVPNSTSLLYWNRWVVIDLKLLSVPSSIGPTRRGFSTQVSGWGVARAVKSNKLTPKITHWIFRAQHLTAQKNSA